MSIYCIAHVLETHQGNQKKLCCTQTFSLNGKPCHATTFKADTDSYLYKHQRDVVPNRMSLRSSLTINVTWCHNKQLCAKTLGLRLTTERQLGKCGKSILIKPELQGSLAFNTAIHKSLGRKIWIITRLKTLITVSLL
jgi:hypothetical protein